ncbi:hypothetical protein VTI74DRAFT_1764 [Chaetomium olivicolor]
MKARRFPQLHVQDFQGLQEAVRARCRGTRRPCTGARRGAPRAATGVAGGRWCGSPIRAPLDPGSGLGGASWTQTTSPTINCRKRDPSSGRRLHSSAPAIVLICWIINAKPLPESCICISVDERLKYSAGPGKFCPSSGLLVTSDSDVCKRLRHSSTAAWQGVPPQSPTRMSGATTVVPGGVPSRQQPPHSPPNLPENRGHQNLNFELWHA